jgi:hypothetical protein
MTVQDPNVKCYCNFCGSPIGFQISRVGQTVNCFACSMETVLFIPGLQPPYEEERYTLETREVAWSRNEFGVRTLVGVVENCSRQDLDWVRIEFILYDRSSVPVGTTSDCLLKFPARKLWKFRAPIAQGDVDRASEALLSCEYGRVTRAKRAVLGINGNGNGHANGNGNGNGHTEMFRNGAVGSTDSMFGGNGR